MMLGGCDALRLGFLNAQGPVAASERTLFVNVVLVMLLVIGPVLLLTPIFAWHYRLANTDDAYRPKWNFSWIVEVFIWVPPTLIVVGLAILLWTRTHQLDPYAPLVSNGAPLEVQAVALDWKWLFVYPDARVATINELAIPAGRPVHIRLTSGTVMQSLLVPQLAGQIYAMSGMTTELNLAADRPGVFRGENTQFNGKGFQQQKFSVVSLAPADYESWLARVRATGRPLDADAYRQLFVQSAEPAPILFSSAPADLFEQVLARDRPGPETAADAARPR